MNLFSVIDKSKPRWSWFDFTGGGWSGVCSIHCLTASRELADIACGSHAGRYVEVYSLEHEGTSTVACIGMVEAERRRQVGVEGYNHANDDLYTNDQLTKAAVCYAMPSGVRNVALWDTTLFDKVWPWSSSSWKPTPGNRVRELVKAAALIVAEIERIQRAERQVRTRANK